MGIFHMIPPLLHLQPGTKTIMRPTTSDPTETDNNGEPELPGAGAGATSFAPSDNAVGALADVDGCIPTNLIGETKSNVKVKQGSP